MASAQPISANAQSRSPAWKRFQHLQHEVAVSGWFSESRNYTIPRLRAFTTPADFEDIPQLGFDHIRIRYSQIAASIEASHRKVIGGYPAENLSSISIAESGTSRVAFILFNRQPHNKGGAFSRFATNLNAAAVFGEGVAAYSQT